MADPFPDCCECPRVYAVPSGLPFADTFAVGLRDRLLPLPPDHTARTQVFVSGLAQVSILQRVFREVFATGFLPSVHSLRNVEADPAIVLPSAPSTGRRHRMLVLCRLVNAFLQQQGDPASGRESVFLAARLGALLDELLAEGHGCLGTADRRPAGTVTPLGERLALSRPDRRGLARLPS